MWRWLPDNEVIDDQPVCVRRICPVVSAWLDVLRASRMMPQGYMLICWHDTPVQCWQVAYQHPIGASCQPFGSVSITYGHHDA